MIWIAGLGWGIAITTILLYGATNAEHARRMEGKENARDIWRNEANRLAELVLDRENAIAHLRMEIEALTPKRNARGKFVAKDAEL